MPHALISVYNKWGITDFARELIDLGWTILSSGGTARTLAEAGVPVTDIATIVGPEMFGGRVKTLSRELHGALLARDLDVDIAELERLGVPRIDLLCSDLYPLEAEIARPGSTRESVIEQTDIGGPAMLRSAAKGRRIVLCDAEQRDEALLWIRNGCPDKELVLESLAAIAEAVVARYCLLSARYTSGGEWEGFIGRRMRSCAYGENAWQQAAGLYATLDSDPLGLDEFQLIESSTPSYNNWCDVDRLLQTLTHAVAAHHVVTGRVPLVAVAVKHGNSCGAAVGDRDNTDPAAVICGALYGDPRAVFGGLLMTNFQLTGALMSVVLSRWSEQGRGKLLLDGMVAPNFDAEAVSAMQRKGGNCRFLVNPALAKVDANSLDAAPRFRYVRGGFLLQPNYTNVPDFHAAIKGDPRAEDLALAWAVGSTSNSNTTTIVKDGMVLGNGAGRQDRVGSCELAVKLAHDAGHDTRGAVAYSDSFFPFPDGPNVLMDAGVTAILASSGSIRDHVVQRACEARGVKLFQLPDAELRGFYAH